MCPLPPGLQKNTDHLMHAKGVENHQMNPHVLRPELLSTLFMLYMYCKATKEGDPERFQSNRHDFAFDR
jgi:hypothetical protein